jgi:hypothetical protein
MATSVKNLTKMGTDVRKIAALLRAKAPEGHILAYISPEEAQLLKDRGGSGKPHADTGIPSFELDDDLAIGGAAPATQYDRPGAGGTTDEYGITGRGGSAQASDFSSLYPAESLKGGDVTTQFSPETAVIGAGRGLVNPPEVTSTATSLQPQLTDLQLSELGAAQAPPSERSYAPPVAGGKFAELEAPKTRSVEDILGSRLGVAGVTGLLGALQARKASQAGQQGAADIQKLAAPYQQTGQQLQAQAQAGTLTPAGQQSLQALQAQVAQGVQARGGVGAQQAQAAVEQLRQQLLQQQYDYGLKLSGIGDNIAIGAIKTGMQADQYANQLTSTYFNNMARIAAGTPTTVQIGGTQ